MSRTLQKSLNGGKKHLKSCTMLKQNTWSNVSQLIRLVGNRSIWWLGVKRASQRGRVCHSVWVLFLPKTILSCSSRSVFLSDWKSHKYNFDYMLYWTWVLTYQLHRNKFAVWYYTLWQDFKWHPDKSKLFSPTCSVCYILKMTLQPSSFCGITLEGTEHFWRSRPMYCQTYCGECVSHFN